MYDAYAVTDKGRDDRYFIGRYETEQEARNRVRDAIASGYCYGYVKRGHEIVCYLTEESFAVRGLIEKAKADWSKEQRGEWISRRPPLRVETS